MIDRRSFLGAGALGAAALRARAAHGLRQGRRPTAASSSSSSAARPTGSARSAPVGDPAFAGARGASRGGFRDRRRSSTRMFALHPALADAAGLYGARQALFVHAVASPYRDRSHFDGQNVLETGGAGAYQVQDGWLNRLLGAAARRARRRRSRSSATVPLALRGPREVASYAPSALPRGVGRPAAARRRCCMQGDSQLHGLWSEAMSTRTLTSDLAADNGRNAAATGALAARLLAPGNGARIAMIETGGWDTHAGQRGRLGGAVEGARRDDRARCKTGLGPVWATRWCWSRPNSAAPSRSTAPAAPITAPARRRC